MTLGEGVGETLLKHKGVAEGVLENYGAVGLRALAVVNPRNGRRLLMLEKTFTRAQQMKTVMDVVAKYGDKAATWIWDHKGVLAVSATLAAFLADPEPFINGTKQLGEIIVKDAVVPVTSAVINGGANVADSVMATRWLPPSPRFPARPPGASLGERLASWASSSWAAWGYSPSSCVGPSRRRFPSSTRLAMRACRGGPRTAISPVSTQRREKTDEAFPDPDREARYDFRGGYGCRPHQQSLSTAPRARRGGGTAARRGAWSADLVQAREGVILRRNYCVDQQTLKDAFVDELVLNDFASSDPTEWGLDVNAGAWCPTDEDKRAADWEIHELWG